MVKTVVDPEGEAITRTLRYVETGPNTGRVFQETHSDGSWTRYHYDSNGRIETRASAVLDADASSTEATSLTRSAA
ncbi:MAG: hypothetical protein CSA22_06010 [Deltaproteobacteria bacterium]|nr:MAG: hypothetical protein CSA22_06010 [Deltaproteobacteria bacterium]